MTFLVSTAGCEVTKEVPLSFSKPEQGVPVTDPGVGASSTSFDEAEASPPTDISSPAALVGKSFLITLPTVHDMGSHQRSIASLHLSHLVSLRGRR